MPIFFAQVRGGGEEKKEGGGKGKEGKGGGKVEREREVRKECVFF